MQHTKICISRLIEPSLLKQMLKIRHERNQSSLEILINSFVMEHDAPRGIVVVDCATHASCVHRWRNTLLLRG